MSRRVVGAFKGVMLGLLYAALASAQPTSLQTLRDELRANNPDAPKTLKQIAATRALYQDSRVQNLVIQKLNSESNNPNWGELAEMESYEAYYGELLTTVQVFAAKTDNRAAWVALASANYNASSPFGQWLATQPHAIPVLIELSQSKLDTIRSRTLEVMAYSIESCNKDPQLPVCDKKEQLRAIILRQAAEDAGVTDAALSALDVCGTASDIPLLEFLRTKFHDPQESENYWRGVFVDRVERDIRQRASRQQKN